MEEPPFILDGTRVVEYASLDGMKAANNASAVVNGVAVDLSNVAGVAVTEELVKGHFFLLHCNDRWEMLAADTHASVADAHAAAQAAYGAVDGRWTPFRALTKDEQAELESTRRFLRELVTDFPDD